LDRSRTVQRRRFVGNSAAKRIRNPFKQRPGHQSEALFNSLLGAATVIVVHGSLTQDGVKLRAFNETGGTYPGWLVYWRATGK
ncbi:hypothetical protein NX868_11330, partial [Burkholderia thailandensis]|nr:hypothetical protein [Burkholderia thailandensis]MCS6426302.1 hypothetical protein [Burkholderia thailandensis]MCS6454658.1 hypothetical protein [Burkholderia thailandensis]MCS6465518.1 hypothetical protein [Burkholderia thailandensis]MCS6482869.1 hypothetical protein [Burkholderia thailandensis]